MLRDVTGLRERVAAAANAGARRYFIFSCASASAFLRASTLLPSASPTADFFLRPDH